MQLHILPKEQTASETMGKAFENNFQQTFGSGMQALANMKMQDYAARQAQKLQHEEQQYQQAQKQQGLNALFNPEQAQYISMLDPKSQQEIIKQRLQQPKEAAYLRAVNNIMGGQPTQDQGAIPTGVGLGTPGSVSASAKPNMLGLDTQGLTEHQVTELVKIKQAQDKAQAKMSETDWKKAQYYDKRSEEDYVAAKGQSKAAHENNMRFDRMRELIEKGEMPHPLFATLIDGIGKTTFGAFDLTSILGADAEEFKKLSSDMVKGIKDIYGARITNNDLEQFLKTIPTLVQTNEGKLKLIHNLELLNKGQIEQFNIMNKIMEEHDGMRPKNFDALVEKEWRPKQKALAKEFKKGIHTIEKPLKLAFNEKQRSKQAKIDKHIEKRKLKEEQLQRAGMLSDVLFNMEV